MIKLLFSVSLMLFATAILSQSTNTTNNVIDNADDYALLSSYEWLFKTNNTAHCKVADVKADDSSSELEAKDKLSINSVNVFPNPVNTCRLNIEFEAINDQPVNLKVTDLSGQLLHSTTIPATKGKMQYQLNMDKYASSFVIVTLYQEDFIVSRKVLLSN